MLLTHSPRLWVRELHFHLVDHGGALVHGYALSAEDASSSSAEVVVLDDICSFLSSRLVSDLKARGVTIVGVFDPADGKTGEEYLADLGVGVRLSCDAAAERFVAEIAPSPPSLPGRKLAAPRAERNHGMIIAVAAASGGAGATEVAAALSDCLSTRRRSVTLVDADEVTPSLAQRLNLALQPNLRTAIESLNGGTGDIRACLVARPSAGLKVLAGLPNPRLWHELRPADVAAVVRSAAQVSSIVVVNVGSSIEDLPSSAGPSRFGVSRAVVAAADAVVLVGAASPIGVSRIVGWLALAERLIGDKHLHVVMNRFPGGGFRSGQIRAEIGRFAGAASVTIVPHDPRVDRATWQGRAVARGRFRRAVGRLSAEVIRAGTPP